MLTVNVLLTHSEFTNFMKISPVSVSIVGDIYTVESATAIRYLHSAVLVQMKDQAFVKWHGDSHLRSNIPRLSFLIPRNTVKSRNHLTL